MNRHWGQVSTKNTALRAKSRTKSWSTWFSMLKPCSTLRSSSLPKAQSRAVFSSMWITARRSSERDSWSAGAWRLSCQCLRSSQDLMLSTIWCSSSQRPTFWELALPSCQILKSYSQESSPTRSSTVSRQFTLKTSHFPKWRNSELYLTASSK